MAVSVGSLLSRPGFRRLYLARLASQAADGVLEAALVSFVVFSPDRATSAGAIAAAISVALLPFSVIEPVAGIVLDRVSRRQVLVVANLLRSALTVLLAILVADHDSGVAFLGVALLCFSAQRFVLSALSAGLPMIVTSRPELVTANSLSTTSGSVSTIVGAGAGAAVRALVGSQDSGIARVMTVAAVAYLLAAGVSARMGRADLGPPASQGWSGLSVELRRTLRESLAGAAHLSRRTNARNGILALSAYRFCYGVVFVATILLYRNYFHGPGSGLGGLSIVVGAGGVGTVLAALVTPSATRRVTKPVWISALLALAGVAVLGCGLPYDRDLLVVASLVLSFVTQGVKICVDTLVQEDVDDTFRGRAFSIYDMTFNVSYAAAAGAAALVVPTSGKSPAVLAAAAAGCFACALGFRLVSRPAERSEQPAQQLPENSTV